MGGVGGVFLGGHSQPSRRQSVKSLSWGRPACLDRNLVLADGDPSTRNMGIASAEVCVDQGSDLAMPGVGVSHGTHEPGKGYLGCWGANYLHCDVRSCVVDAHTLGPLYQG